MSFGKEGVETSVDDRPEVHQNVTHTVLLGHRVTTVLDIEEETAVEFFKSPEVEKILE